MLDLDDAIRLKPNEALTYAYRDAVYQALRQPERAIRDLGEAIRRNPRLGIACDKQTEGSQVEAAGTKTSRA